MEAEINTIDGAASAASRVNFSAFDYIRLLAAASVIYSHAFIIAQGSTAGEPLNRLLGGKEILGHYGVLVFFAISGFLITQSAMTSRTLGGYAAKRIGRIYPGLIVCLLLTSTILGAAFATNGSFAYLASLEPLKYTLKTLLDYDGWYVNGMQFYVDQASIGSGMNGVLWTISQELLCYLLLGGLMALRLLGLRSIVVVLAVVLVVWFGFSEAAYTVKTVGDFFWVSPSFLVGSLCYMLRSRVGRLPAWPIAGCLLIFIVAAAVGRTADLFSLFGVYPLLWLATRWPDKPPSLRRIGDASYGMYIYGWPLGQVWRAIMGPTATPEAIFFVSLLSALVAGFLSWHLVEKPALTWVRRRLEAHRAAKANDPLTQAA